jgi:hypothetical protein
MPDITGRDGLHIASGLAALWIITARLPTVWRPLSRDEGAVSNRRELSKLLVAGYRRDGIPPYLRIAYSVLTTRQPTDEQLSAMMAQIDADLADQDDG